MLTHRVRLPFTESPGCRAVPGPEETETEKGLGLFLGRWLFRQGWHSWGQNISRPAPRSRPWKMSLCLGVSAGLVSHAQELLLADGGGMGRQPGLGSWAEGSSVAQGPTLGLMCHVIMTLKFLILFGQGGRRFNLALGLMPCEAGPECRLSPHSGKAPCVLTNPRPRPCCRNLVSLHPPALEWD